MFVGNCLSVRKLNAKKASISQRAQMNSIRMPNAHCTFCCLSCDSIPIEGREHTAGERFKRSQTYQAGSAKQHTSELHQPTSSPLFRFARQILSLQSKQSCPTSLRAIRLQQRCNLDSRRMVRTHHFPSYLQIGEADGDAPV